MDHDGGCDPLRVPCRWCHCPRKKKSSLRRPWIYASLLAAFAPAQLLYYAGPAQAATGVTVTSDGTLRVVAALSKANEIAITPVILGPRPGTPYLQVRDFGDTVAAGTGCIPVPGMSNTVRCRALLPIRRIYVDGRDQDDRIRLAANVFAESSIGLPATVLGGSGDDRLDGGKGPDTLDGGGGNDGLFGQRGNDILRSGSSPRGDVLRGEQGNDTLYGGNGGDSLDGNDGNDTLDGAGGVDTLRGSGGDDRVDGGTGNDFLDESSTPGNNTLLGGDGDDELLGSDGLDTLRGGAGVDSLVGGDSRDHLFGEAGNDRRIDGQNGNDHLDGGDGDDDLDGSSGDDSLLGRGGNDTLRGLSGADFLRGGDGNDTLNGRDQVRGNDTVDGETGSLDACLADVGDTLINCEA
ncbi:calcium-binding protein [Streptomyces viridiviolaceus]